MPISNLPKGFLGILLISLISVVLFSAYNIFFVFPAFTDLMAENSENYCESIAGHVKDSLFLLSWSFDKNSVPAIFRPEDERMRKNFGLWKIMIFSATGQILFSSDPADEGQTINGRLFFETVARGNAYKEFVPKNSPMPGGGPAPTDIVTAFVPVIKGGKFIGACEVYMDASGMKTRADRLLLRAFLALSLLVFGLLGAVIIASLKAGRYQAAREKAEEHMEKSLREKETLLRELYHRTKNNMQVITSLINLQSMSISDSRVLQMFDDTKSRIQAMALVHEKLYQSKDLSSISVKDYIRDLAGALLRSFGSRAGDIKLALDIEDIPLPIDVIIPCGLIINELMSNSLKYAFPQGRPGEIRISFHVSGNRMEFVYSDDGIGLTTIDIDRVKTLGLKLVKNLATRQLGGILELVPGKGAGFRITFTV